MFDELDKLQVDSAIDIKLNKIKAGDTDLKEKLIRDYNPFILKIVSKVSKKYIEIENSEEYCIGLLAFNEAIDCFDKQKQKNFLNFCEQVIKRRIIDYIRSNQKNNKVYPFTYFETEENNEAFEEKYLRDQVDNYERIEVQQEIASLETTLKDFGISLEEVASCSPKHKDSKVLCLSIAKVIANNETLYDRMMKTKKVPVTELLKCIKVSERTIERNRKYIIALISILRGSNSTIKDYVENTSRGGNGTTNARNN